MTTSEIKNMFGIASSTLSDWGRNPDKEKLAMLLRAIGSSTASELIQRQSAAPKYSFVTRRIKLDKKEFRRDLLWSIQDGDVVEIDKIITLYLDHPDQDDTDTMLKLFGAERLKKVAKKQLKLHSAKAFNEATEQIAYAEDPINYYQNHQRPTIESFCIAPKKREANWLVEKYGKEELIKKAEENSIGFTTLFKIRKMIDSAA